MSLQKSVRTISAITVGILIVVVLSSGTDALMHGAEIFPPAGLPMLSWQWGLAIAYRVLYTIIGGFACARLAPTRPLAHGIALGIVGTCIGAIAAFATWDLGPEFGPKWFQLLLAISAMPSAWVGARWSISRRDSEITPSDTVCPALDP